MVLSAFPLLATPFRTRSVFSLLALAAAMSCGPRTPPCRDTPGVICTWAGNGEPAFDGDRNHRLSSSFYWPMDMEFSPSGQAFVLDWNNHRIRRVNADDTLETVVGTDFVGDGPEDFSDMMEPGAPGTSVNLNHPTDLLFLPDGRMLISTWHNHKIRRWDPATGRVVVTCGAGPGYAGDGGPAAMALLNQPNKIVLDAQGNLYIADQRNQRIRKIDTSGVISTVVGTGVKGYGGDNGPPLNAQLSFPTGGNPEPGGGLAIDTRGRLFIADTENHRIRMVDFAANVITTIAGTGTPGYSGDNGPATMAQLNFPRDIEFGPDGRLYIADTDNHRIRAMDLNTGTITTVAGTGTPGFSGDNGPATMAQLYRPFGIAFDSNGYLYIVDTYNHRIRRVRL